MERQRQPFKVIIIGGSISGLTLAHALSRLQNIDFIVLENRDSCSSQSNGGAALTLLPNGLRILDQLGLFKRIQDATAPIHSHSTWLEDGRLLKQIEMQNLPLTRNGYPLTVIERRALLDILLQDLDKKRIYWNKRAIAFRHCPSHISVKCSDGSEYCADLVIGADGIHSIAQREVLHKTGNYTPDITADFSGIFGISNAVPGLLPGEAHRTYGDGFSFIVTVDKDERVYWLLSIKNETTMCYPQIPRYRQDQSSIDEQLKQFLDKHITNDILFADIYSNVVSCYHVPLEEMLSENWTYGRIVCMGDSVHKMTPNLAQGANSAIESAASLANRIALIAKHPNMDFQTELQTWAAARKRKMRLLHCSSWILARCEAFSTFWFKMLGLYIGYCHGEQVINYVSGIRGQTEKLDFLPVPKRTVQSKGRDKGRFDYWNHYFVVMLFGALRVVLWVEELLYR